MKEPTGYQQGGDVQAISRIVKSFYGGYPYMFRNHGWDAPGEKMMILAPTLIVEAYGSIKQFEELHRAGDLMPPMEAIQSDPPNVWLTNFHRFLPEEEGFIGFTAESARRIFIDKSKPGVLVAVYGTTKAPKDERKKLVGILQCSHQEGLAQSFMSPAEWTARSGDPYRAGKWSNAIKVTRAWRVAPETQMDVHTFAPDATKTRAYRRIGSHGVPLSRAEALNILEFDLQETKVYGESPIIPVLGNAREVLAPSKAGPVSQNAFLMRESEGPKHLYVLKLDGDADAFLGERSGGRIIVKAGFSRSPQMRCKDHNKALPAGVFKWRVLLSGSASNISPYPTSQHAKAGEKAMQNVLCLVPHRRSLGGEFFLARRALVDKAWEIGNATAKAYKPDINPD